VEPLELLELPDPLVLDPELPDPLVLDPELPDPELPELELEPLDEELSSASICCRNCSSMYIHNNTKVKKSASSLEMLLPKALTTRLFMSANSVLKSS
jgi:hypothetical protein